MSVRGRDGFTLIEALIAMTLASLVVGMVASLMVAQGQNFGDTSRRTEMRGTVRAVVELVRADLQSVTRGSGGGATPLGIRVARPDSIVLRVPLTVGNVCAGRSGGATSVYLPSPGGGITNARVSGYGYSSESGGATSDWTFQTGTWGALNVGGGNPKADCASNGADTLGMGSTYYRLNIAGAATQGELVSLFTDVTLKIADSELRPGTKGLFRQEGSGAQAEFASGLTTSSAFAYRHQNGSFQSSFTGNANLRDIVEIQLTIEAERRDPISGTLSTYEWITVIPLRNVD